MNVLQFPRSKGSSASYFYVFCFMFLFVQVSSQELIPVRINQKWGYIDSKGNIKIPTLYSRAIIFTEGLAIVEKEDNGPTICIDTNNTVVFSKVFSGGNLMGFSCGYAVLKGEKSNLVNKKGDLILTDAFHDAHYNVSENFLAIKKGSKWGFVRVSGEIIKPEYEEVGDFHEGLAWVKKKGKYGFIDTSGTQVVLPIYRRVLDFNNGYARVSTDFVSKKDSKYEADNRDLKEWKIIRKADFKVLPFNSESYRANIINGLYYTNAMVNNTITGIVLNEKGDTVINLGKVNVKGEENDIMAQKQAIGCQFTASSNNNSYAPLLDNISLVEANLTYNYKTMYAFYKTGEKMNWNEFYGEEVDVYDLNGHRIYISYLKGKSDIKFFKIYNQFGQKTDEFYSFRINREVCGSFLVFTDFTQTDAVINSQGKIIWRPEK